MCIVVYVAADDDTYVDSCYAMQREDRGLAKSTERERTTFFPFYITKAHSAQLRKRASRYTAGARVF